VICGRIDSHFIKDGGKSTVIVVAVNTDIFKGLDRELGVETPITNKVFE
jgi:hypothetical protein